MDKMKLDHWDEMYKLHMSHEKALQDLDLKLTSEKEWEIQ